MQTSLSPRKLAATEHATELQQSCNRACTCSFTLTYWAIAESRGMGVKQHPTDREQHWMVSFFSFAFFLYASKAAPNVPRASLDGLFFFLFFLSASEAAPNRPRASLDDLIFFLFSCFLYACEWSSTQEALDMVLYIYITFFFPSASKQQTRDREQHWMVSFFFLFSFFLYASEAAHDRPRAALDGLIYVVYIYMHIFYVYMYTYYIYMIYVVLIYIIL